jgi:hypothetical protein
VRVWAVCLLALTGCSENPEDANYGGPQKYFARHPTGGSADWAVVKWHNLDDHVATVHGFSDDAEVCWQVVEAMNARACQETGGRGCLNPFSCAPLN